MRLLVGRDVGGGVWCQGKPSQPGDKSAEAQTQDVGTLESTLGLGSTGEGSCKACLLACACSVEAQRRIRKKEEEEDGGVSKWMQKHLQVREHEGGRRWQQDCPGTPVAVQPSAPWTTHSPFKHLLRGLTLHGQFNHPSSVCSRQPHMSLSMQGGIPARRLRLNVHTFEVRECHPHPFATDSSLLHLIPHPLNGSPTRYTHQPPSHLSHRSSSSTSKGRAPPDFTAAPGLNPIRHSSATTAHLPGLHAAKTSSNLPSAANRALMGHRVGGALAAAAAGLLPGYRGGSTTRKRRSQGVKVLSYRCGCPDCLWPGIEAASSASSPSTEGSACCVMRGNRTVFSVAA
eukprot:1150870-Pelagomonas_calceolata.AAC.4